jgi:hypothetical protein
MILSFYFMGNTASNFGQAMYKLLLQILHMVFLRLCKQMLRKYSEVSHDCHLNHYLFTIHDHLPIIFDDITSAVATMPFTLVSCSAYFFDHDGGDMFL